MSQNDIREWARANGIQVGDRGALPANVIARYELAQQQNGFASHPDEDDDGDREPPVVVTLPVMPPPVADRPAGEPETEPEPKPERKPQAPPKSRRRLFKPQPQPGTRERKPKRVSIENVVSSAWTLGAMAFARSPEALPVARVLSMQAPVAGVIVEDIAKDTIVDRILQPIARGGERAEKAVALLGPPLLVGLISAQPQLYQPLRPILRMTIMSWLQISKPAMDKAAKKAAEFAEQYDMESIDAMMDALWADWPGEPVPSEQEEENIRRARGDG